MDYRQTSVEFALNELAWLGSLQLALKFHQTCIEQLTEDLLKNPQKYVHWGLGVSSLAKHYKFDPYTSPGAYRNKTAIIYLVSVLEGFLGDVCEKCLSPSIDVEGATFGAILRKIINSNKIAGFEQRKEVKCINLVRLIRNAIVHEKGLVTAKFWRNPDRPHDSAERYIEAWPGDKKEFRQEYYLGKKVWLHIDEVVIRSIFCAIDFVQYMDREFQAMGVP